MFTQCFHSWKDKLANKIVSQTDIQSNILQSTIKTKNSIDYFDWTRCKARNILTGIALVKRAIKILSILSVQSEVEDDFIAAMYGHKVS